MRRVSDFDLFELQQIMVAKAKKNSEFARHDTDTGSSDVQIATLSERIIHLTEHLKLNKKDFSSMRGLIKMVSRRRRLLDYVHNHDVARYQMLTKKLKLRR